MIAIEKFVVICIRELVDQRLIKTASGYGATIWLVVISESRVCVSGLVDNTCFKRPTVVCARFGLVEFFPILCADVTHEDFTSGCTLIHSVWITQTIGVYSP